MNKTDETRCFVLATEHYFPHKPGMLSPNYKQAAVQYPFFPAASRHTGLLMWEPQAHAVKVKLPSCIRMRMLEDHNEIQPAGL